ncbi:sugar transferase [Cohnella hashimotonis]|uniref:Sugar transferase n=1 Tax=Cohnella hashimotonis TaxID=2826895 RepID=A0ABT6TWF4_9BACL|nr:sugar transferase [Cohnella hashimotonis]MDI4650289.1 sugar transferase [Cohnella hashimotonis]
MEAKRIATTKSITQSRIKAVGNASSKRIKLDKLKRWIQISFLTGEYGIYILTFYLLMYVKVIPDYPAVHTMNPIHWIREVYVFDKYLLFLGMILLIHGFIRAQGVLFSGKRERGLTEELLFSAKATSYAFLMSIGITFLLKTTFIYSRVTLVTFAILMLVEAIIWRATHKYMNQALNAKGYLQDRVLIIGAGKVGNELQRMLEQERSQKFQIVGYLDDYKIGSEVIGKTAELEAVLQNQHIDIVYITIPSERTVIDSILHTIYKYNVDIRIIPEMFDRMSTVFAFHTEASQPYMEVVKTPLRGMNIVLKRLFDMMISAILLILLSPVFFILGLWIKLDSNGPIFFKQVRVGKNGVPFSMMKFRSMCINAELQRENLAKSNEVSGGPAFKVKEDPRVTRSGRWLRKYSLDELPQLWNVLRGDMSLIGPRPPLPDEVAQYTNYHWRRMDVLPGMTGLWQVSGRSDLRFEEWIDLDIQYIERWSIALEMKILLKTIPVVIKGTGAY